MKKIIVTFICFIGALAINAQTVSDRDKKFVDCALHDGMMEVKLGELAQSNASSAEVKNLGKHMIDDHTKAGNELKAMAERKRLPVPSALTEKQQKAYDKLAQKKGTDFDKAYSHCMVKDHKKAICKFKKEAKKGDDSELKTWADKIVPTLEHHKHMSEQTCKDVRK